jgi:hypothetical protein
MTEYKQLTYSQGEALQAPIAIACQQVQQHPYGTISNQNTRSVDAMNSQTPSCCAPVCQILFCSTCQVLII